MSAGCELIEFWNSTAKHWLTTMWDSVMDRIDATVGYDYQLLDEIDLWLDDLSKGTEALHGSDVEVGANMEELAATIYSPIAIDLNGGKKVAVGDIYFLSDLAAA
jgi:hypothetical protein